MKAIGFEATGGPEQIRILTLPSPALEDGDVRLRFLSGSLNHLDLWVLKGLPRVKYQFPHICGADLCGEVVESKSPLFQMGDRVLAYPAEASEAPENLSRDFRIRGENMRGVFSEEIVLPAKYLRRMPTHLNVAEAAALPLVYLTAWQMVVEKAQLSPESSNRDQIQILVHGAGSGVSHAVLELLLSFGYSRIVLTSRDESKLKAWTARGVSGVVSLHDVESQLKAQSSTGRFHLIFDHVGEAFFEMNIRLLETGGRFVTCGATSGALGKIDLRHLYFRQLQLLGSTMGSLKHFQSAIDWVERAKIRPRIAGKFGFQQGADAFKFLQSSQQDGKIIIEAS